MNPRYPQGVHKISSLAPSTTRPPLPEKWRIGYHTSPSNARTNFIPRVEGHPLPPPHPTPGPKAHAPRPKGAGLCPQARTPFGAKAHGFCFGGARPRPRRTPGSTSAEYAIDSAGGTRALRRGDKKGGRRPNQSTSAFFALRVRRGAPSRARDYLRRQSTLPTPRRVQPIFR